MNTPGNKFRDAIADNKPLMVVGAINAYCAKMAEKAGHKALYLSGAGVANASFGLPDLAITTLNDVAEDSRRITQATNLPLLIDIDTGFGGAFSHHDHFGLAAGSWYWHFVDVVWIFLVLVVYIF